MYALVRNSQGFVISIVRWSCTQGYIMIIIGRWLNIDLSDYLLHLGKQVARVQLVVMLLLVYKSALAKWPIILHKI